MIIKYLITLAVLIYTASAFIQAGRHLEQGDSLGYITFIILGSLGFMMLLAL